MDKKDEDISLDELSRQKNQNRYSRNQRQDRSRDHYKSRNYDDRRPYQNNNNTNRYHNNNNNYRSNHHQRSNNRNDNNRHQQQDFNRELEFDKYDEFIQRNLANKRYGIIFLGTNDYEKDFQQIDTNLKKHQNEEENDKIKTAMLVSNGWIYVLDSLFQTHNKIENVLLYDMNPAMLMVYDLIHKMIKMSETRQDFISNCFCRKFTDEIDSNDKMLEYLKEPINEEIKNKVIEQLDKYDENKNLKSSIAFNEILYKYAIEKTETRQLYPLYLWDEKQMYIDGRKMHTTHRSDKVYDFFTTFYYGILSPFMKDEQYIEFRQKMVQCKFQFVLGNIYHLLDDKIVKQHKEEEITIYIDGIDEETCHYLKNTREFLFKKIQEFNYPMIKLISTKSGITKITPEKIQKDEEFNIYPYKRELNYGEQRPERYAKEIWQMVEQINME